MRRLKSGEHSERWINVKKREKTNNKITVTTVSNNS